MLVIDWRAPTQRQPQSYRASHLLQIGYIQAVVPIIVVRIPLRRFPARQRLYRFEAVGEYQVHTFPKTPTETYDIAVDFRGLLPTGRTLVSGVLSATEEATGSDATSTVLASATGLVQDADLLLTPQAGDAGHDYVLMVEATLDDAAVLVEQLRMQVRSKL